ncbi:alpha/beta fold hydrolase [Rhodalgimonas zhirmunskyi]|uniref:Alpha/beta hydrolase n=1 Tax=Rhodalgimonas zhirmunskyi TaxID=2964767 RepID=A0AAJ1UA22_9RHOB|nr:alpha/beta hydrolase [Rhodoalgimonas zhirmunskyi]MDQ2094590.1 alpha/beta hydrolase [Rhodoalgimonas zhirmunskyi]
MPKFTTPDGISLHYTDEGEGTPILALAGLTRNGSDFDFVAPHLDDVRLIRLDYRGRGQSDWADFTTYTIPQEAADALALLDHLGLDKVAILGTSRGGLIAMTLAATAKERLSGVALNDIGPELDPAGLEKIAQYIGIPPAAKTRAALLEIWPVVNPGVTNLPPNRFAEEIARLYDETPEGLRLTYDPALREAVLAAGNLEMPDLWPLFDALSGLPLCALRGEHSDILPAATFEEMKRRRPDMIAALVPDRRHVPYLDEEESLAALRKWIDLL